MIIFPYDVYNIYVMYKYFIFLFCFLQAPQTAPNMFLSVDFQTLLLIRIWISIKFVEQWYITWPKFKKLMAAILGHLESKMAAKRPRAKKGK